MKITSPIIMIIHNELFVKGVGNSGFLSSYSDLVSTFENPFFKSKMISASSRVILKVTELKTIDNDTKLFLFPSEAVQPLKSGTVPGSTTAAVVVVVRYLDVPSRKYTRLKVYFQHILCELFFFSLFVHCTL